MSHVSPTHLGPPPSRPGLLFPKTQNETDQDTRLQGGCLYPENVWTLKVFSGSIKEHALSKGINAQASASECPLPHSPPLLGSVPDSWKRLRQRRRCPPPTPVGPLLSLAPGAPPPRFLQPPCGAFRGLGLSRSAVCTHGHMLHTLTRGIACHSQPAAHSASQSGR